MTPKILTVDDSRTIRMIIAKAFKPYDCAILEAENGLVALAVARREQPNLIILDYTMPVMDGFETLTKLRADPALRETPVVMLTAEAGRDTVLKIARLGVREYLVKPFKEEALIERVSRTVTLRAQGDNAGAVRRFDDPLRILVVDDKPAIIEQMRAAFADTRWVVTPSVTRPEAAAFCAKEKPDLVIASLSLPGDDAFSLLMDLRADAATRHIPVMGLAVKTAVDEQARALQGGFFACATKPLDSADLKAKITRALKLETSYRYFLQQGSALCLKLPAEVSPSVLHDVKKSLDEQLTATVDAGSDKFVIDLQSVEQASVSLVEFAINAIHSARQFSLRAILVGSEGIRKECRNFEETHDWNFVASLDEALT